MEKKVKELLNRLVEVEEELGSPDVMSDQARYKELASEHKHLSKLKDVQSQLEARSVQLEENRELVKQESDQEMLDMVREEISEIESEIPKLKAALEALIVPPDKMDNCSTIVEIRAGTGGDEAALFVADCVRMYSLYADKKGWKSELLSSAPSELGGFKEYQFVLSGDNVYRLMKYEAGTHRVQRVPATETQGRVHTSAVTVAIIPEPPEEEKIEVEEKDLKIDTYRASGAGGQHVNTTDSAVRITHIPTGIVVCCQDERSQIKNRDKALRLLNAKIADETRRTQQAEISSLRASQVGSGDRSERIRTYNFPQNRLTDHRIDLTLYKLDQVMEGDLEEIIQPLVTYFYQKNFETDETA